jgi:hypothetical protein
MVHLLACLWILIGFSLDYSWLDLATLRTSPNPDIYISALYWVVTTLTTVGYGDIKGAVYQEYLFTMAVEFLGIAFFALIMGSINKILNEDDGALDIIDDKIEEVDLWLMKLDNTR